MKAVYFNDDTIINLGNCEMISKVDHGPDYCIRFFTQSFAPPSINFHDRYIRDREFASIMALIHRSGDGVHKISKTGNPL